MGSYRRRQQRLGLNRCDADHRTVFSYRSGCTPREIIMRLFAKSPLVGFLNDVVIAVVDPLTR